MRFLILFFLAAAVAGFAADSLRLDQAIQMALEHNYDIRLTRGNVEVAEINNSWGAAGGLPSLSISVSETWTRDLNSGDESDRLGSGATLDWLLFDGLAVHIRKSRLEDLQELSNGNLAVVVENTVQQVILSYYNILYQAEQVKVLQDVMQLSQDRYDLVRQKQEMGASTTYEMLQAKNSYLDDRAAFLLQEVNLRNAHRRLNFLLGKQNSQSFELTESFEVTPQRYDLERMREKMLANNSTLQNQYLHQQLLAHQVRLEKSAWSPSLSLRVSANDSRYGNLQTVAPLPGSQDAQTASAALSLSWSLFNGGNRRRAIQIAKVDENMGEIELTEMRHSLSNELLNYADMYEVRLTLLEIAEEALETARLNLQISEEKFKAGAINSFNFRDVQLIYLNSAVQRLNAIYNLIDIDTALLRLTGGILFEYE